MAGLTAAHIEALRKAAGAAGNPIIPAAQIADLFNEAMTKYGAGQFTNKKRVAALLSECLMESAYFRTTVEYASTGPYQPYRGRTFIQITWESNYAEFGAWCVKQGLLPKGQASYFVNHPVQLGTAKWAALGGVWYFTTKKWGGKNLCQIADGGSSLAIGRAVNLGNPWSSATPNGQSARDHAYKLVMSLPDDIVPGKAPSKVSKPAKAKPKAAPVETIHTLRKAKRRIKGYAAPSSSSKVKRTVPKGYHLEMVHRTVSKGRVWVQGTKGVWWLRSSTDFVATIKPAKKPAKKQAPKTVTVHSGDTLGSIAAHNKTTVAALVKANHIADPDRINAGATLVIK